MSQVAERKQVVRPLPDGRLVIPTEFREAMGLAGGDPLIVMTLAEGELRIRPASESERAEASNWLEELYDYFAPVREEIVAMGLSEEEVNADIDAAVRAVRAERGRG